MQSKRHFFMLLVPISWALALYVTDKTNFKLRDDLVTNPVTCQYESLFIETVMHDHKVIIGVIYKPPESNTDIFVAHFSDLMGIISKERNQCIVMGDFNLDLNKIDTHITKRKISFIAIY